MSADSYSSDIITVARALGLSDADARLAAEIGVAAALAESSLLMYANDGSSTDVKWGTDDQLTDAERAVAAESMAYPHDAVGNNLDSMGLFQQRPGADWGDPAELMDACTSAGKFYNGAGYNKGLMDVPGWQQMSPGYAAWTVQQCAPDDMWIYDAAGAQATAIVDRLWPVDWFDGASDAEIRSVVADVIESKLGAIGVAVWTTGINERGAANAMLNQASLMAQSAADQCASMPVAVWTQLVTDEAANVLLARAAG